jgi:hypothetical protein
VTRVCVSPSAAPTPQRTAAAALSAAAQALRADGAAALRDQLAASRQARAAGARQLLLRLRFAVRLTRVCVCLRAPLPQSGAAALAALERDVEAALAAARAEDAHAPRAAPLPPTHAPPLPDAAVASAAVARTDADADAHHKWSGVARWAQRDSALAAALGQADGPEDRRAALAAAHAHATHAPLRF